MGDNLSGSWATVGVLTELGSPKVSSTGKNYCIWKMGCLNETNVSVFLFGDAYTASCKEKVGMVFALFNATVRRGAGVCHGPSYYDYKKSSKGIANLHLHCLGERVLFERLFSQSNAKDRDLC